jgi:hypothetical protein
MSPLPLLAQRYLGRALLEDRAGPESVRVEQTGEMWMKPGGRSRRFRAIEEFSVKAVQFTWEARFPLGPLLAMHVLDQYANGQGLLEGRFLGRPLMRQSGSATNEGEAMRYLAELPWVPYAIRSNRELEWNEIDARTLEVATQVGQSRVAVRLGFDEAGDLIRAWTDARPHPEGEIFVPRPWGGVFYDFEVVGGLRIPRCAEVAWELPGGLFTYWQGEVSSVQLVPAQQPRFAAPQGRQRQSLPKSRKSVTAKGAPFRGGRGRVFTPPGGSAAWCARALTGARWRARAPPDHRYQGYFFREALCARALAWAPFRGGRGRVFTSPGGRRRGVRGR